MHASGSGVERCGGGGAPDHIPTWRRFDCSCRSCTTPRSATARRTARQTTLTSSCSAGGLRSAGWSGSTALAERPVRAASMIRFLCPPRSGCSLAAGWLRLHGAVALFSAEQACKLCVEYTLKQEAPCFQPLVVHGRACRSVPDGAGGPLRALPCPPMFGGFRKTKRRAPCWQVCWPAGKEATLPNAGQKFSDWYIDRQRVRLHSAIRAGAVELHPSSTLRFFGAKTYNCTTV